MQWCRRWIYILITGQLCLDLYRSHDTGRITHKCLLITFTCRLSSGCLRGHRSMTAFSYLAVLHCFQTLGIATTNVQRILLMSMQVERQYSPASPPSRTRANYTLLMTKINKTLKSTARRACCVLTIKPHVQVSLERRENASAAKRHQ